MSSALGLGVLSSNTLAVMMMPFIHAIRALRRLLFDECFWQSVRLTAVPESFERSDAFIVGGSNWSHARENCFSVDDDRTGSALAETAAEFWTLQSKRVTEHIQQWSSWS